MSESFPLYHKIETLFERKADFSVDITKIRKSCFNLIYNWEVTEKIDGTNIRVMLSKDGEVKFGGRSNAAQLPCDLLQHLIKTFPAEKLREVLWVKEPCDVMLVGEGYGAGIQKGGGYREDKAFILFDCLVAGKWWLDGNALDDISLRLGIPRVNRRIVRELNNIIQMVENGFTTYCENGKCQAEGIVARPLETMYDKNGDRIIFKLKTKDFKKGGYGQTKEG